jgi:hypothetical protein
MKLSDAELRDLFQRKTAPSSQCLDEDALIRAARGEFEDGERERVIDHIAHCSDCAREFHIARELLPLNRSGARLRRASWLPIAASVLLVFALAAIVAQRNTITELRNQKPIVHTITTTVAEPARVDVDAPIVDLDPDVTRGANDVATISVPQSSDVFTLILHLPEETRAPIDIDIGGVATQHIDGGKPRSSVTLGLHRKLIREGPLTIEIGKTKYHVHVDYQ